MHGSKDMCNIFPCADSVRCIITRGGKIVDDIKDVKINPANVQDSVDFTGW